MVSDLRFGFDPGRRGAPLNHHVNIGLQRRARELVSAAPDRAEQGSFGSAAIPGALDIRRQVRFKIVATPHKRESGGLRNDYAASSRLLKKPNSQWIS